MVSACHVINALKGAERNGPDAVDAATTAVATATTAAIGAAALTAGFAYAVL